MDKKFSRLRLTEFAKRAAVAAVGGAVALQPIAVDAATGSIQVHAGNAIWFLNTNITFSTTSSDWGFSEASLHTAGGTRNDAYDGALSWHVSLNPIGGNLASNGYQSPGGVVDIEPSPASLGDPTIAKTVNGKPQTLAGLTVTGQVYFSVTKAVARSILFMQNPTGADITVNVFSASNLGSDNNTTIKATSSGDNPFNFANDHWVVSCQKDTVVPTSCSGDPVLTFALSETGAPAQATAVLPIQNGSDLFYWAYNNVTVPAGQTRAVMVFSQLSDTVTNAQSDAMLFNSGTSLMGTDYLSGLTATQRSEIVNWKVPVNEALTVNHAGTGFGTITSSPAGINCGTTCGATFTFGTQVMLTATPSADSVFVGWSGGQCNGNANPCTLTLTTADTETAIFNAVRNVLWRDTNGNVGLWVMNGPTISQTSVIGNVTPTWSIVGQRDFNGDGNKDILWRDSSGNVAIWLMNGNQIISSTLLGNVPTNWSVVGTGDFNGDGKGDILWRDSTGNLAIWFMNGTIVQQTALLGNIPNSWTVAGADTKGNIFWRNTATGDVGQWILNGTTVTKAVDFGPVPLNWTIAGIGDFDGNGSTDILWTDTAGNIAIWLMNGTQIISTAVVGKVPAGWSIAQTGDYNADGKTDILLTDSASNVGAWFMNGTTITSTVVYGKVGPNWTIQSLNSE